MNKKSYTKKTTPTNDKIYDYAIFGGGVVGTAIMNKLTRMKKNVILIEKAEDVCTGASKANSAIVHAGFDAESGTLKAKLNIRGNKLIRKLCKELDVPFQETGAVVVGNDLNKIQTLYNRGLTNGIKSCDLKILNQKEIMDLVPNLRKDIKYALLAKTSGIINIFMFTIALAEEAVINGADFRFSYNTTNIDYKDNIFVISNGKEIINAKKIINCAGAGYNDIAKLLQTEQYELTFRRGEYFVLDKEVNNFVKLTVFPLPTNKGKGILATPTTDGNILLGPTSTECLKPETIVTSDGLKEIKENISLLFENPLFDKAIREYSGIRVGCGKDFIIQHSKINPNVINICGINSPGLTASPAIAELVCEMEKIKETEKVMKKRYSYNSIATKTNEEIDNLIKKEKKYGKIICNCEMVSLQEILNAIHSPLRPHTLDGVKRRVRSTAGHCQGGFCTLKVAHIISNELNIPLNQILKENAKSFLTTQ